MDVFGIYIYFFNFKYWDILNGRTARKNQLGWHRRRWGGALIIVGERIKRECGWIGALISGRGIGNQTLDWWITHSLQKEAFLEII